MIGRGEECHQVEGIGISLNGVVQVPFVPFDRLGNVEQKSSIVPRSDTVWRAIIGGIIGGEKC